LEEFFKIVDYFINYNTISLLFQTLNDCYVYIKCKLIVKIFIGGSVCVGSYSPHPAVKVLLLKAEELLKLVWRPFVLWKARVGTKTCGCCVR
jgi:hypothetical protein